MLRCNAWLPTFTSTGALLDPPNFLISFNRYVRDTFPKITPLIWEDHLRTMSAEQIVNCNLPSLVEPVVWNYHPNVAEYISHETWTVYSQVFKNIWIASAFKGATAPDSILPNISGFQLIINLFQFIINIFNL